MSRRHTLLAAALAATAALTTGCGKGGPAAGTEELTVLAAALDRRLLLAGDIAWFKFHTGAAVRDPAREEAVLARITSDAAIRGIEHSLAREFFEAQLAASRQWQQDCLDRWRAGQPPPPGTPPDLTTIIRPRMDEATRDVLEAWIAWMNASGRTRLSPTEAEIIQAHLQAAGYSPEAARLACGPIASPP